MVDVNVKLAASKKTWLVTGCAGFIGSHIIERLLSHGQTVRGLDNFATGHKINLESVKKSVGSENWSRFTFVEGSLLDPSAVNEAMQGVDVVSHQAALGSVPRSIEEPINTVRSNVEGFMTVVKAAADLGVKRIVYASSSSVYGDHPKLPKVEDTIGAALSPYAASKRSDEIFAEASANSYGIEFVGLRYFNIFGSRQDPEGAYAAVIPKWLDALLNGEKAVINGDPTISRDFTFVDNAVDANILGALACSDAVNTYYNIGNGGETSLAELYDMIADLLLELDAINEKPDPVIGSVRPGDVKHSLADISKAERLLGYEAKVDVVNGMRRTVSWYKEQRSG